MTELDSLLDAIMQNDNFTGKDRKSFVKFLDNYCPEFIEDFADFYYRSGKVKSRSKKMSHMILHFKDLVDAVIELKYDWNNQVYLGYLKFPKTRTINLGTFPVDIKNLQYEYFDVISCSDIIELLDDDAKKRFNYTAQLLKNTIEIVIKYALWETLKSR